MDATGLAIGTVTLVTLFQTVVQISDIIDVSKRYGYDSEILSIKLGIERVRLIMWGEKLGLTDADVNASNVYDLLDARLSDRRVSLAVSDVLVCMKRLFEDSSSLTRRYGLREVDATVSADEGIIEDRFRDTFKRAFDKLNSTAAENQRNISLKLSTKWVIVDKKRFELLIQDLRDFNDSLSALFPDVENQTQIDMNTEIKASRDVQSLQLIQNAAPKDHTPLSDAASAQIEEISQREILSDGASSILLRPVDIDALAKQIDRLELQLMRKNRGMLTTEIQEWGQSLGSLGSLGPRYTASIGWEVNSGDYFVERDRDLEYVKPLYLAWRLQFTVNKNNKNISEQDFSYYDAEAGRKFIGKIPATLTVEGYAAEFSVWARVYTPETLDHRWGSYVASHEIPDVSLKDMIDRIRVLQLRGGLLFSPNDKRCWEETKKFVGTRNGWVDPKYEYELSNQTMELLGVINRSDTFDFYATNVSMGCYANGQAKHNIWAFLYSMMIAYEALIRLEIDKKIRLITPRAMISMTLAEIWMESVIVTLPDEKGDTIRFRSLVHERQTEGLIRFAEAIDWPHISVMREFVEDAYVKICGGGKINMALWSWIYGLALPGNNFIYLIMSSLVTATPSLMESIGPNIYAKNGLVLSDRSYWRAQNAVGKVLAGVKGTKMACGWIGPCPVPDGIEPRWIQIKTRPVEFRKPDRQYEVEEIECGHGNITYRHKTALSSKRSGAWIKAAGDPEHWRVVDGITRATEECQFKSLRLQEIPSDIALSGNEPAAAQLKEYRATVDISIAGELVTYTLYSNPCFITAPHCIDGPHSIHVKDLPRLENTVNVGDLKSKKHNDTGVLIINATCEGGELVARAWCAENEQHAVIRRALGPCLICAVIMASEDGLGVNCLIWTETL